MSTTDTDEVKFDDALRGLRRAYYSAVADYAKDIIDHAKDNPDDDRESIDQYIHESIDGSEWVIYTQKAQIVLLCSDNDGTYESDFGAEGMVEDGSIRWERLASAALRQDVNEQLDAEGFDLNADNPGADWIEKQKAEAES